MTDSRGRRSNNARATVSPPIPESKTPSGALFMNRNAHRDAAGDRAHLEIGRKIAQVRRDVGFGAGEEVVENPEYEPVLHLLALGLEIRRVNLLVVARLLLRLERHHGGNPLPGDECGSGHRPVRGGLPPARQHEGAEERSHGSDATMHGVGGEYHVARVAGRSGILTVQAPRRQDAEQCDSDDNSHRATSTFNRPRSSSTVHSFTPGSRSSPSTCMSSNCSGERTTSLAVLTTATSRIVTCVPRITRGIAIKNRGSDTRRIRQTSSVPSVGSASGAKR